VIPSILVVLASRWIYDVTVNYSRHDGGLGDRSGYVRIQTWSVKLLELYSRSGETYDHGSNLSDAA
jgi:hypothetical protein